MRRLAFTALLLWPALSSFAANHSPIIDVHIHAMRADGNGPVPLGLCIPLTTHHLPTVRQKDWMDAFIGSMKEPACSQPIWSPTTDEELVAETVSELERLNVFAILSGPPELVRTWRAAAPDRFISALDTEESGSEGPVSLPANVRPLLESGEFRVLAEMSYQYAGIAPNDERLKPYWALAEELDVPVGIHLGEGPPGASNVFPSYRVQAGNPLLLEDVLARHPRLRIFVMHYGSPMIDEMVAMLVAYPQLYVDIGGIQWMYPRNYFYDQLRQLVDAGFVNRIMFGSDSMVWPGAIEQSINIIQAAPFLSEREKRDILYNNAARFLRLSEEEIAEHHR